MEAEGKRQTDVQQQRQPGDSLHGEDEEGDHGQAPTLTAAFDLLQALFEGSVAGPDRRAASRHPLVFARAFWQEHWDTHSSFCSVLCWNVSLEQ